MTDAAFSSASSAAYHLGVKLVAAPPVMQIIRPTNLQASITVSRQASHPQIAGASTTAASR